MQLMPKRKRSLAAIGLIVAIVALIFVVMWIAGIGIFTTTTTTTATTTVKITAFNPGNEVESQAYFVSLWSSTKATQAEIARQEQVLKSNPSVANQTNLVGLKQQCALLATEYNAAALAITRSALSSAGLPSQISPAKCSS